MQGSQGSRDSEELMLSTDSLPQEDQTVPKAAGATQWPEELLSSTESARCTTQC